MNFLNRLWWMILLACAGCDAGLGREDQIEETGSEAEVVAVDMAYIVGVQESFPHLDDTTDQYKASGSEPTFPLLPEHLTDMIGEELEKSVIAMKASKSAKHEEYRWIMLTHPSCVHCKPAGDWAGEHGIEVFDVTSTDAAVKNRFRNYTLVKAVAEFPCWVQLSNGTECGRLVGWTVDVQKAIEESVKSTSLQVSGITIPGPAIKVGDFIDKFRGLTQPLGDVAVITVPKDLKWTAVPDKAGGMEITFSPAPGIKWKKFIVEFDPTLTSIYLAPGWQSVTARLGGILPDLRIPLKWSL